MLDSPGRHRGVGGALADIAVAWRAGRLRRRGARLCWPGLLGNPRRSATAIPRLHRRGPIEA